MTERGQIDKQADRGISIDEARTLAGLFRARVKRMPDAAAYRYFDHHAEQWRDLTWRDMAYYVARWQVALERDGLQPGDRVAIMLRNGPEWIAADQAALGLGLVVVPLYVDDNAGNMAYMLEHSGARVLVLSDAEAWRPLQEYRDRLGELRRVVTVESEVVPEDDRVVPLEDWLPAEASKLRARDSDPEALATIIYTSGTTGRPKGVMLSHANILWNAWANSQMNDIGPQDVGLSFLPLAHVYERTSGYYLAVMLGVVMAFNRSVDKLLEDIQIIQPTVILSVPRIFERVYSSVTEGIEQKGGLAKMLFYATIDVGYSRFEHSQGHGPWRLRHLLWPLLDLLVARKIRRIFGPRLHFTVSGGAALAPEVARMFLGMGVDLRQGYGLTEASPTVSTNPADDNDPASVGVRLPDVQIKVQQNGELLVKSPGVMMGYWKDPEATRKAIDELGWLHTGDKVSRIEKNRIYLTGRFKEIIVMSNGEKASPVDMEQSIVLDPVIEQVMMVGEGRPYMAALVVLSEAEREVYLKRLELDPDSDESYRSEVLEAYLLRRIGVRLSDFPHYAQVRRVAVVREPWTVHNGMLTPTMKVKRRRVLDTYPELIEQLYEGHARVEQTDISRNVRVAG